MLEGIVLAGGLGTRLRQVVPHLPKPMAPIDGRPFLEILLSSLARKGFGRLVLAVGFMADKIVAHFGSRFEGMTLDYVVEEAPLGTGGAVRLAMVQCLEDHVFVFNGDTYLDVETDAIERQWQRHRFPIIVGRDVPDTARYARLLVENHRVKGFMGKGMCGPGLINAGCYLFPRHQLSGFPPNTAFSLEEDYLAKVVAKSWFEVFVTSGHFIDIGVPEDYGRAQIELRRQ